ncbi:hypothetical protein A3D11_02895 [Candidatus Peribacteria bacterium RIFCSPHIGHO2_02_FULL_49_16]|nr:MAG: hypothetical protein A2880_01665 [Candidatus Peribacteria bacterium RIFCSPHIGHO2_01_FULL_49_38]OGJ58536.1 MAG: hypothetical protein A3D11_02895 [Candidatus Peribacteria bacterium RIFCSPHIGHO2_02_FULL_49_16]
MRIVVVLLGLLCGVIILPASVLAARLDNATIPGIGAIKSAACPGPVQIFCDAGEGLLAKLTTSFTGLIVSIATGIAICMLIYASIQMITAQGSEEKLSKARTFFIITLVGVMLVLAAEPIVRGMNKLLEPLFRP